MRSAEGFWTSMGSSGTDDRDVRGVGTSFVSHQRLKRRVRGTGLKGRRELIIKWKEETGRRINARMTHRFRWAIENWN